MKQDGIIHLWNKHKGPNQQFGLTTTGILKNRKGSYAIDNYYESNGNVRMVTRHQGRA